MPKAETTSSTNTSAPLPTGGFLTAADIELTHLLGCLERAGEEIAHLRSEIDHLPDTDGPAIAYAVHLLREFVAMWHRAIDRIVGTPAQSAAGLESKCSAVLEIGCMADTGLNTRGADTRMAMSIAVDVIRWRDAGVVS